jgi:uncharacterized protein (DUF3820 family)
MIYTKFPFGKYKGQHLDEIPTTYIAYALEEFELPDELQLQLRTLLALRLNFTSSNLTEGFIKKTFKELSLKYHPDHGGSHEAFIAITEFKERLLLLA